MSALKRPTLVGSLLVRKGAATATGQTAHPVSEIGRETPGTVTTLADAPYLKSRPAPPIPIAPEKRFGRQKPQPAVAATNPACEKKMRLTLGLDSQMHLRLKLAAVHNGTNMRSLIITAIENHLAALGPEIQGGRCACLQAGSLQEACAHKLAEPDDDTD